MSIAQGKLGEYFKGCSCMEINVGDLKPEVVLTSGNVGQTGYDQLTWQRGLSPNKNKNRWEVEWKLKNFYLKKLRKKLQKPILSK